MATTSGDPATRAVAITPNDSTIIRSRAIYVGGTGDVAVVPVGGSAAVTFKAVPVGAILPISCKKVMSTGTTATLMLALY